MIRKYLDLSTAHLTEREAQMFTLAPVTVHEYEYGAWVWVPPDDDSFAEYDWEEFAAMRAVLVYARSQDCDWVQFDSDAPQIAELPTFDW